MCGGSNTTTSTSTPPPEIMQAYTNLINQGQQVASAPLQQYTGPLVAGFTPLQQQSQAETQNAQTMQMPYINAAAQYVTNSAQPISGSVPQLSSSALGGLASGALSNIATGAQGVTSYPQLDPTTLSGLVPSGLSNMNNSTQNLGNQIYQMGSPSLANVASSGQNLINQSAQNISSQLPQYNAATLSQYMDPYNQNVMQSALDTINNQDAQQQQSLIGNAIANNAFGGDRSAVMQSELAGQQDIAKNQTIAQLLSSGYLNAQQALQGQQQLGLSAATAQQGLQQGAAAQQNALLANQQNLGLNAASQTQGLQQNAANSLLNFYGGQQGLAANTGLANAGLALQGGTNQAAILQNQQNLAAQLGEFGAQQQSNAAAQMAGLGNQAQTGALNAANALNTVGTQQQQLAQSQLNVPYEQFLQQQAYPFQTTQFLQNLVEGIGGASGGSSSTTQPAPSPLSQVLGLATAAIPFLKRGGLVPRARHYDSGGLISYDIPQIPMSFIPATSGNLGRSGGPPAPPKVPDAKSGQPSAGQFGAFGKALAGSNLFLNPSSQSAALPETLGSTTVDISEPTGFMDDIMSLAGGAAQGGAVKPVKQKTHVGAPPAALPLSSTPATAPATAAATTPAPVAAPAPAPAAPVTPASTGPLMPYSPMNYSLPATPQLNAAAFTGTPGSVTNFMNPLPQLSQPASSLAPGTSPVNLPALPPITYTPPHSLGPLSSTEEIKSPSVTAQPVSLPDNSKALQMQQIKDLGTVSDLHGGGLVPRKQAGGELDDPSDDDNDSGDGLTEDDIDMGEAGLASGLPSPVAAQSSPQGLAASSASPSRAEMALASAQANNNTQPQSATGTDGKESWLERNRMALLYAGLGMMSGTSPFPGVNVGQGALSGLKEYQKEQQAQAVLGYKQRMADIAQQRATSYQGHLNTIDELKRNPPPPPQWTTDDNGMVVFSEPSESDGKWTYHQVETGVKLNPVQAAKLKLMNAQTGEAGAHAANAGAGSVDWKAGVGPDPNNPSAQVPGSWAMPTKPGAGKPVFYPGVTQVSTQPTIKKDLTPQEMQIKAFDMARKDWENLDKAGNLPPETQGGMFSTPTMTQDQWLQQRKDYYLQNLGGSKAQTNTASPKGVPFSGLGNDSQLQNTNNTSAARNAAALTRARSAIAQGAPVDAVKKRLRDNGIDPTGL